MGQVVSGKGFTVAISYIGLSVEVRLLYDLQSCQLLSLGANKKSQIKIIGFHTYTFLYFFYFFLLFITSHY